MLALALALASVLMLVPVGVGNAIGPGVWGGFFSKACLVGY